MDVAPRSLFRIDRGADYGEEYGVTNHFTLEGKLIFDWIANDRVPFVEPFDETTGEALCVPMCGPYVLQPIDDGSDDGVNYLGLEVDTATDDYYLFVEYRSQSTQGAGALLTWSKWWNNGATGKFGNTVVVDGHPDTVSLYDVMLKDAEHVVVDFGAPGSPRNASLYFDVVDGNMEVTIYATTTPRPSLSMAPTTAAPSQTPSAEAGACGKTKFCCDFIDLDGYQTFYKIRDVSGDAYCCTERCSYANAQNYYLHYKKPGKRWSV